MEENKDFLGTEPVGKLLWTLALPSLTAQIINMLYNIVDRIYIGHIPGIGAAALTGVGLFTPILMLLMAFASLLGAGGAPLAAISMGKGDNDRAEKIMGNCCTVLLILSAVLTVLFYVFAPQMLWFFGGSEQTMPYALVYTRIYVLGSVFVLVVLGMNPFVTAQGFAKISMMTTVIGAVINIVLDPIFIFGFHWGVFGAGLATALSQAVGAIWILVFLRGKKTILRLNGKAMVVRKHILMPCLALGISTFVMLSTEALLSMSFTTSLAKFGGDLAVGSVTILVSLTQLINMPLQGLTQGAAPIISFNFGARNIERTKEAFFTMFAACVIYALAFWAVVMIFPSAMVRIFTSNQELAEFATWAVGVYMACIFTIGFQNSCQQSFMALGQAKTSLLLACLRKLILLIPLIFILPHFFENKVFAVFLAEPVSDVLAAVTTTAVFLYKFPKILKQGPKAE